MMNPVEYMYVGSIYEVPAFFFYVPDAGAADDKPPVRVIEASIGPCLVAIDEHRTKYLLAPKALVVVVHSDATFTVVAVK